jgi:mono/diheme cytochrome c family protein
MTKSNGKGAKRGRAKRDAAALAVALGLASAGSARAEEAAGGRELFVAKGCPTCHAVPAAGIEAKVKAGPKAGPALPGAIAGREDAWVRDFVRQKVQADDGTKHAFAFQGDDAELAALIGWLRSLPGGGS